MSADNPSDDELRLLSALLDISEQTLGVSAACVDHGHVSPFEHAVLMLARYDLVVPEGTGGSWTTKSEILARLDEHRPNFDEIRKALRDAPAGQLRTFPNGVRALKPDIFLAGLRMWIPGRARDKDNRFRPSWYPELSPDRLDVEARLGLGAGGAVIRGELLTTGELRAFRDQLAEMERGHTQQARLVALKQSLEIDLVAQSDQKFAGQITIRNPLDHYSATAEIRSRVYLDRTIRDIDHVLENFA